MRFSSIKIPAYLIGVSLILSFCARKPYRPPERVQTGLASWYGPSFHGRTTSSAEIFNMYDLTAAHRSLPFGTQVMVTNLKNGKSVIVRINDRGPFIRGRIIDLSYAAARMLDMVGDGVVPVRIEVLQSIPPEKPASAFAVQVGAFIYKENALALQRKLQKTHSDVYISKFETPSQTYYRVRIKARSLESAERIARELLKNGYSVFLIKR
ncbi:MAG: septal ring lytic transglycosylase RlpA family protein [Candidatus Aminicenantales bacterium]